MEALLGLQYVMDRRIRGGQHEELSESLMERLCEGLLLTAGKTYGNLLRKRPTEEADAAFFLFGEFLEEGKIVKILLL
jgi:Ca2+-transporting ATPase